MKAKKVRLLAGGLAAIIIMSNMAAMPVFAGEANADQPVAVETVAEEAAAPEESGEVEDAGENAAFDMAGEDAGAVVADENVADDAEEESEADAVAEDSKAEAAEESEAGAVAEDSKVDAAVDIDADDAAEENGVDAAAQDGDSAVTAEENVDEASSEEVSDRDEASDAALTESDEAGKAEDEKARESEGGICKKDAEAADLLEEKDAETVVGAAETGAEEAAAKTEAERAISEAQKEAERIEKEVTSVQDILVLLMKQNTANLLPTTEGVEVAQNASKSSIDVDKTVKSILNQAYSKAIDTALGKIPFAGAVSGPLKGLVLKMLGVDGSDEPKPTDPSSITNKKIDESREEIKRAIETVPTIGEYGTRLDNFTTSVTTIAQKMEKYDQESSLTENERAIKIAALVGNASEWASEKDSIFNQMNFAAQTMRTKSHEGPKTDVKARNLYDVFYDYNKETSMFSGEAMNKADNAITLRTNEYVANCAVLVEVLKAHERVADMTDAEVAALSKGARDTYEKIKSDKMDIRMQIKEIFETFTGNKESSYEAVRYGILDAAGDYYNKDKTTLIEKEGEGFKETKLSADLYTIKSESFSEIAVKRHSALSEDQVKRIQAHVNSIGTDMCKYLESVGFNMERIKDSGRTPYLSTLKGRASGISGAKGVSVPRKKYFSGINMTKNGAEEEEKRYHYYYKYKKYIFFGETVEEETNRDDLLVVFQAPKAA